MRPTIDDLKTREDLGRSVDVKRERKLPCPRCGGGPGQLVRPCMCKLTEQADASGKLEKAT